MNDQLNFTFSGTWDQFNDFLNTIAKNPDVTPITLESVSQTGNGDSLIFACISNGSPSDHFRIGIILGDCYHQSMKVDAQDDKVDMDVYGMPFTKETAKEYLKGAIEVEGHEWDASFLLALKVILS